MREIKNEIHVVQQNGAVLKLATNLLDFMDWGCQHVYVICFHLPFIMFIVVNLENIEVIIEEHPDMVTIQQSL